MALDEEDRRILGEIAREALCAAASGREYIPADPDRPALLEKRGVFVTLKTKGRLRGCLGCFASETPLYRTVAEYARHSLVDDPRFGNDRLRLEELDSVAVDISALTPLEPCADPAGIILGVHGIYVSKGGRSGCFLPQVATETGWSVEEFWGHCCCDKAGLDWNAWREPGTKVMTFTADVFDC